MQTFTREARPSERTAASTRRGFGRLDRDRPHRARVGADLADLGHAAADGVVHASLVHGHRQQRVARAHDRVGEVVELVGLAVERGRGGVQPGEQGARRRRGRRETCASATGTHCSSPSSSTACRALTSMRPPRTLTEASLLGGEHVQLVALLGRVPRPATRTPIQPRRSPRRRSAIPIVGRSPQSSSLLRRWHKRRTACRDSAMVRPRMRTCSTHHRAARRHVRACARE